MDRVERVARAAHAESMRSWRLMRLTGCERVNEHIEKVQEYLDATDPDELWGEMEEALREHWRNIAIVAIREAGN